MHAGTARFPRACPGRSEDQDRALPAKGEVNDRPRLLIRRCAAANQRLKLRSGVALREAEWCALAGDGLGPTTLRDERVARSLARSVGQPQGETTFTSENAAARYISSPMAFTFELAHLLITPSGSAPSGMRGSTNRDRRRSRAISGRTATGVSNTMVTVRHSSRPSSVRSSDQGAHSLPCRGSATR